MDIHAVWTKDVSQRLQARLMNCFTETFDQKKPENYFQWKFRDNPFGDSLHVYVEVDKTVVASRAFWRMDVEDQVAYQCVDTAVLEAFRGRGVFSKTLDAAKQMLIENLIYNLPNNQSGPLYLRSGWETIIATESVRVSNKWMLERAPVIDWNEKIISWRFERHPSSQYFQIRKGGNAYILARRRNNFYVLLGKTTHNVSLEERAPWFFFSYDKSVTGIPVKRCLPLMYYANQCAPEVHRYLLDMA